MNYVSISDLLILGRPMWYKILASGWTANSPCTTISRERHLLVSSIFVSCISFVASSAVLPMQRLVSALVLSRLDYCNAVLSELPSTTLDWLRRVLNAAICLVAGLGPRDHVTEQMKKLYWLPIKYRINFKLCLMMHAAVTGQWPQYIRDIVHPLSTLPGRNKFRAAASGQFDIFRTRTVFGERAFFMAGTCEWNTLPQDIKELKTSQTEKLLNELLRHIILN